MKNITTNNETIIIGAAQEIKAVYRSMVNAVYAGNTSLNFVFGEFPKFKEYKLYGICIEEDGTFYVQSADAVLCSILGDGITHYEDKNTNDRYIIGSPKEIKAIYSSMERASHKTDLCPIFSDKPRFNMTYQKYAICISSDKSYCVVNSNTMLEVMLQ